MNIKQNLRFSPLLSLVILAGVAMPASGQVVPRGWKQTFGDGFNGALDTKKWTVATHKDFFNGATRSNQFHQAANIKSGVKVGTAKVLQISSGVRKGVPGGGKITSKGSGHISNVGILRARVKLNQNKNKKFIWPTFWAIENGKGELDIFEGKNLDIGINYASHSNGKIKDFGYFNQKFSVTAWRTYGVWIRRGSTRPEFYANTKAVRLSPKGSWNPRAKAFIRVTSSPNLTKKLVANNLPKMLVDWVSLHKP